MLKIPNPTKLFFATPTLEPTPTMGIKRIFIGFGVLAICSLLYGIALFSSPLPLQVIDRNRSGVVSITEALDALDVGKRDATGKPNCTEYYWLKDGLPAYEICTK
ncbi:MAG: hypothetical protein PHH47_03965 [Gallionella sp.]|nr:hypothetical protein [Gallionella sp.]MDD4946947.1 hypothetical protein [Gallionella sp.]MDD5611627.1 hypothetical protein [Gallionella sp.]